MPTPAAARAGLEQLERRQVPVTTVRHRLAEVKRITLVRRFGALFLRARWHRAARCAGRDDLRHRRDRGGAAGGAADGRPTVRSMVRPMARDGVVPRDARVPSGVDAPVVDAPAAMSLTEGWRLARLYRGQASYDAAIRACIAIADAQDRTWSPIALVEAIRIEIGPLTSPSAPSPSRPTRARCGAVHFASSAVARSARRSDMMRALP